MTRTLPSATDPQKIYNPPSGGLSQQQKVHDLRRAQDQHSAANHPPIEPKAMVTYPSTDSFITYTTLTPTTNPRQPKYTQIPKFFYRP